MTAGYQHLRVADGPGVVDPLPASAFRPSSAPKRIEAESETALRVQLEQAKNDTAYFQREMKRAIREREEIKASLGDPQGPAAYWRREAKNALQKLGDARRSIESLQAREEQQRARAIQFSEDVDRWKVRVDTLKRGLWEVFGGIPESPIRQQLWEIWIGL